MSDILTDRASWRVLLPREIFVETVTALSKRVSREAGATAAQEILDRQRAGDFVFAESDPLVYETAIELLQEGGRQLSLLYGAFDLTDGEPFVL